MHYLVVGGAGYIGSHAVDLLVNQGHKVTVLDNLVTGHQKAIHPEAEFVQGDVRDRQILDQIFADDDFDGVFHFAAFSLVGESVDQPLKYFDNNVQGMIQLLESMQEHQVKKIVFSSTAAVYGNVDQEFIQEDAVKLPTSPYGESKLMMEKIIDWCDQAYGIRYVSLRYFNVAGAKPNGEIGEDHHPETHLIPIILQVAQGKRDQLEVFGDDYPTPDGTCIRDYIHVSDLVEAHALAMDYLNKDLESQIINLGSNNGYSVLQMLEAARRVTNHSIPARIADRRPGDPARLVASSQKAREVLGWVPQITDVHEMIQSAWEWFNKYPQGYKD